jgi:DNA-binding ferritin-like protein (Dps family)
MNILNKVIGEKTQWKQYKARKKQLPANYRAAVDALERHIFYCGPETGEATMRALDDLIDLFEQSAAAKTPIRDIVGENPADFAEAFISNYTKDTWRERQVRKLNDALEKAIML